jgi:5-methylcytosine-specific restriction protein B
MITNFAKADNEGTRAMFRALFDESVDLEARVNAFQDAAEDMRAKYDDGTWRKHYQNTNAISTYLWLRYPDKYYMMLRSKPQFSKIAGALLCQN